MNWLLESSIYFPPLAMRSSSDDALKVLGVEPERYLMMVVTLSVAGGLAGFAVSGLVFWVPLLVAGLLGAFLLTLPKMELRKRADEVACAMPFFLRGVGMLLEMGLPFRKALEAAAHGEGALQDEMEKVLRHVDEGMPLQRALASLISLGSLAVKRAVSQMIMAYETGASGAEMRRIGDELLSLERHRLKEYGAKSALFGLLFVISSAVMPTFFMVYAIAGGNGVGRMEMSIAMLVVFPAVGALMLLLSKAMMPRSALPGYSPGSRMLLPAGAFIAGFVLLPQLQTAMLMLGGAIGAFFAWKSYSAERRHEEIERALPDALFCASGMPGSSGPEKVLAVIEEGGFGALSEEAGRTKRQMEMNVGVGAALDDMAGRNRSPMLERACRMLMRMVETSSLDRLSSLAEDMINAFQEKRERSQLFSMQKYTLVLGAFLMPLIMKMALGLLGGMGGLLGKGAVEAAAVCASLVPPYVVIYSTMAAVAISDAEGKGSSLGIYAVGLSAVGLLSFRFINF